MLPTSSALVAREEYELYHDKVGSHLHWCLCRKYGLEVNEKSYRHKPGKVIENDQVKNPYPKQTASLRLLNQTSSSLTKKQENNTSSSMQTILRIIIKVINEIGMVKKCRENWIYVATMLMTLLFKLSLECDGVYTTELKVLHQNKMQYHIVSNACVAQHGIYFTKVEHCAT